MLGRLGAGLFAVCTICCGSSPTQPSPGIAPARVLIVTYTTGYRHSSIDVAEPVLEALGRSSGLFTPTYCRTASDVNRFITASGLAGFEGLAVDGHRGTGMYRGNFDQLLGALAGSRIVSLESREPTLEEVFLGYYSGPKH